MTTTATEFVDRDTLVAWLVAQVEAAGHVNVADRIVEVRWTVDSVLNRPIPMLRVTLVARDPDGRMVVDHPSDDFAYETVYVPMRSLPTLDGGA